MNTYFFQSCGHCWIFQICWHIECSTFTASAFRIWNSSTGIPSPPLTLFIVILSKTHLTSHSRIYGSRWVIMTFQDQFPLGLTGLISLQSFSPVDSQESSPILEFHTISSFEEIHCLYFTYLFLCIFILISHLQHICLSSPIVKISVLAVSFLQASKSYFLSLLVSVPWFARLVHRPVLLSP